ILVEELGINELLPAYLDPTLQPEDLITGVNFASGDAGYDPLTSEIAIYFFPFFNFLCLERIKRMKFWQILSLFMIVTGSNDITNTYFGLAIQKSSYYVSSYADLLVNSSSNFVQVIFELNLNSWEYTRLYNEMLFIILKDLYRLGAL
ncbi:putative subtilisin-like protease-like, partial [Capsicum annuum]